MSTDHATGYDKGYAEAKARGDAALAELEKKFEYAKADAEALRGVGANLSIAESVIESLRLALVRFRCHLCKHEHYEPVDTFVCPKCGGEATGSMHFGNPAHREIEEILARYKDED